MAAYSLTLRTKQPPAGRDGRGDETSHDGEGFEHAEERLAERADWEDHLWSADTTQPDPSLREELIEGYRPLVNAVLRRLGRRGDEDAEQVALLALVQAVDRFHPSCGVRFSTFAVPTIAGAIRRYLRDQSRCIRAPRALLDLRAEMRTAEDDLTSQHGKPPTVAALARTLGVDPDRVLDAMRMEETCHPRSLDRIVESLDIDRPTTLEESLGEEDPAIARVEERIAWRQEVATLEPRLQRVIELRYYGHLSQQEAARHLGISQMHVSRLERRALDRLRGHMGIGCGV